MLPRRQGASSKFASPFADVLRPDAVVVDAPFAASPAAVQSPAPGGQHGHSHGGVACAGHHHDGDGDGAGEARGPRTPIAFLDDDTDDEYARNSRSWAATVRFAFRTFWAESSSRVQLALLLAELVLLAAQLYAGVHSHSLALLVDAVHHMLNASSVVVALLTLVFARRRATFEYSYGLDRAEVLMGFSVATTVAFLGLYLCLELAERLMSGPRAMGEGVLLLGIASAALNLVRLATGRPHAQFRSELLRPLHATPLAGWLRVVLENGGALAVVLAALLERLGAPHADASAAALSLCGLFALVYPVTRDTGRVLLSATPQRIAGLLDKVLRELTTLEGVLECVPDRCYFWTHAPGVFCANIAVRVRADADEQAVRAHVQADFAPIVTHLTVQVEKDAWS